MHLLKWLLCWWHRRHIPIRHVDANGVAHEHCVRCGVRLWDR